MKIMSKSSLYGMYMLLMLLVFHITLKAQDTEILIHTSIDISKAFDVNGNYGIKLKDGVDLTGKSVLVHMYSEKRYYRFHDKDGPEHRGTNEEVIYAMFLDENTPLPENPAEDLFRSEALIDNAKRYPTFYPLANLHDDFIDDTEYSLDEQPSEVSDLTNYKNYLLKEMAYNGVLFDKHHMGLAYKELDVVVALTLNGLSSGDVKAISMPGFIDHANAVVSITVSKPNGGPVHSYLFDDLDDIREVKCVMGDKVQFKIKQPNGNPPSITGLPATWLAPMGREYYYHCDPSIVPGGIKPKVPFDVQSHYVSSNAANVERYPDWIQDPNDPNIYSLTWTAQRRTSIEIEDGIIGKYQAQYKFKKADILNKKMQRKSKSEGQIMDFLEIYNKGKISTGSGHSYNPTLRKYYWNVDSDELLYFNTKEYDTNKPGWNGRVKRVPLYKLEVPNDPYSSPSLGDLATVESSIGSLYEPWQLIREGDYTWNNQDGYPQSGFAINELVSNYWSFHDAKAIAYRGYEIEDECLYKDAQGTCITANKTTGQPGLVSSGAVYNRKGIGPNDNNRHPGLVNISVGTETFSIPIKVDAPLATDWGFYGNIEPPLYSTPGADIPLRVVGLPGNMDEDNQARYSLSLRKYSLQDFSDDTYVLGTDGTYNSSTGMWTLTKENIGYEQAWSATLYYTPDKNEPNNKVIVGGGEWKNTNIAYVFTTIQPYGEEEGECKDCLNLKAGYEEFADNYVQSNRYSYDFSTGYTQSYDGETYWQKTLRNYVLNVDDKNTRFVCMDALDNIWDMHGDAYYWGYRALAKQYTDEQLAQQLKYTVTNVKTKETYEHGGRTFNFLPSDYGVGEYELQVTSIIDGKPVGSPKVGIKVVDYDKSTEDSQKGRIYTRNLFAKEKEILGITDDSNIRVAYVEDILSTFKYVDGYRANQHDGSKNRFSPFNDYREDYTWITLKHSDKEAVGEEVKNIEIVQTKVDGFDPTDYWKKDWNNWLRHFSYGKFPVSKVNAYNNQVEDSDYRIELEALFNDGSDFVLSKFLRALIWLAPTDYNGYRINGLMKTIVDLDQFFNYYAFSGLSAPTPPKEAKLPVFVTQEQDLTDDTKYELHLLRKLQNGEMIIYDAKKTKNLWVYQVKEQEEIKFIASNNSPDGIPLTIGQDLHTIHTYGSTLESDGKRSFPIPAAVTSYINLYTINLKNDDEAKDKNGCPTKLKDRYGGLGEDVNGNLDLDSDGNPFYYNKGGGPLNTRQLADTYPNSDLNIGLLMSTIQAGCNNGANRNTIYDMADIPKGVYDDEIDRLITFCKSRSNQTIFLRPGYEFDLVWNIGYEDTDTYKRAFQHIVGRFKNQSVTNVKFVWQAAASPFNYVDYLAYTDDLPGARDLFGTRVPNDPWEIADWYPGNQYVDIIGISYFDNPDIKGPVAVSTFTKDRVKSQRELTDNVLNFARTHNKPAMIAESTPRGYDISKLTKTNTHKYWDGPVYSQWHDTDPTKRIKAGTVDVTPEKIWDDFYQPLFDYVELHGDVIKYFHYIDADWTDPDLQWQWTNQFQYWGNAGVEENEVIKRKWQYEINKPQWIHGNDLHAVSKLTVSNITANYAKFSWPKNTQPEVAKFQLEVTCDTCEPYTRLFNAPKWNSFHGYNKLTPSTTYKATLTNIDYFGNHVGSVEETFTTSLATSKFRSRSINPNNEPIEWNVNIYPNPVKNGIVNIDLSVPQGGLFSIKVYDMSGRFLFSSELTLIKGLNNTHLPVESLPSGVYVINIRGNNDLQFEDRLIIQH